MGEYLKHFFEYETDSRDYFEIREILEKKLNKFDRIDFQLSFLQ